ncbi:MAG: SEC-C domain-containing protein [Kiritimatiellae bacterium]|nr:SEC-C domain-containing protein [Kiritimatiellia bacterium]
MIGQEIIYAPCPCGSGEKFKFCCFKKYHDRLDDDMTLAEVTQLVRCEMSGIKSGAPSFDPEAERLHDEGHDLMVSRDFARARATFRRAREIDPEHNAAWNNEASCAWEMGDYADACDIQREGNANMRATDSFGLARLAVYAHTIGLEDEAVRSLEAARTVPPISIYGALETCFALALYHRHRDIVEYVAKSGMAGSDRLKFYTGIAHANLEEMGQARRDLEETGTSQHPELAERYLDIMADECLPWTADGDEWPYFDRLNFAPARFFAEDVEEGVDPFLRCPNALVEDCIAFLLADDTINAHDALTLARKLTSERASRMAAILEDMVKAEDERDAREEAERLADVDANGNPRVPFYVLPLQDDLRSGLAVEEYETVGLANEMADSQIEPTNVTYVRLENAMREIAAAHPDSIFANFAYFSMVQRHDPTLGKGLRMSFCVSHPDDVRCTGILLAAYARTRKYAEAAEVLDHFAVPKYQINMSDVFEWILALELLQKDEEFKKAYPDAYERVTRFLDKFDHRL